MSLSFGDKATDQIFSLTFSRKVPREIQNSRGPEFPGPVPPSMLGPSQNSRGLSLPARKIQNSQFPQFPGPVPPSTQFPGPVPPSMLSLPACCPSQHVPPSNCRCRSLPGQVCEGQTGLRGTGPAELGTGPARSAAELGTGPARSGPCEVCAELGTGPAESRLAESSPVESPRPPCNVNSSMLCDFRGCWRHDACHNKECRPSLL